MVDISKADWDKNTSQVNDLQKQMAGINTLRSIGYALLPVIIVGTFTFVYKFAALDQKLTDSVSQSSQDTGRIEKSIDKLEMRFDNLETRLTQRAATFIPNPPNPPTVMCSMPVEVGCYNEDLAKVARVDKGSITLTELRGLGKAETTFPVAPGARVLIKSKTSKLEDLKPGMQVGVLYRQGQDIQLIETVDALPTGPQKSTASLLRSLPEHP